MITADAVTDRQIRELQTTLFAGPADEQQLRGWNEITWSFRVDLRPKIGQMAKLIKSSPLAV
jgi:hypothetical protein